MVVMTIYHQFLLSPLPKTVREKSPMIPKQVFLFWHDEKLPTKMRENVDALRRSNYNFLFYLYDLQTARSLLEDDVEFGRDLLLAFDTLLPMAYKSDLWRYYVLYRFGGVYMDCKLEPVNGVTLTPFVISEVFVKDDPNAFYNGRGIYNAFIVARKGNTVLKSAILQILENVKCNYHGKGPLDPTGPALLASLISSDLHHFKYYHAGSSTIFDDTGQHLFREYSGYRRELKESNLMRYEKDYSFAFHDQTIYHATTNRALRCNL